MSVKVLGFDGAPFDQKSVKSLLRFLAVINQLQFTGNYVTGGDTLDWTNGGVNSAVPAACTPLTAGPVRITMDDNTPSGTSVTGKNGTYVVIQGTNLTNWKVKIFVTPGVEYTQGAYGVDVTQDNVLVEVDWPR